VPAGRFRAPDAPDERSTQYVARRAGIVVRVSRRLRAGRVGAARAARGGSRGAPPAPTSRAAAGRLAWPSAPPTTSAPGVRVAAPGGRLARAWAVGYKETLVITHANSHDSRGGGEVLLGRRGDAEWDHGVIIGVLLLGPIPSSPRPIHGCCRSSRPGRLVDGRSARNAAAITSPSRRRRARRRARRSSARVLERRW